MRAGRRKDQTTHLMLRACSSFPNRITKRQATHASKHRKSNRSAVLPAPSTPRLPMPKQQQKGVPWIGFPGQNHDFLQEGNALRGLHHTNWKGGGDVPPSCMQQRPYLEQGKQGALSAPHTKSQERPADSWPCNCMLVQYKQQYARLWFSCKGM